MIRGTEQNILRCMAPTEPQKLKAEARTEREIAKREVQEQKLFAAWLRKERRAGKLYYVWPRPDKATTIALGHPDFTVWLSHGRVVMFEFKAPDGGKHSPQQKEVAALLESLSHHVVVVHTAAQAQRLIELLQSITTYERPRKNTDQTASQT